jgi:hypothetical protein
MMVLQLIGRSAEPDEEAGAVRFHAVVALFETIAPAFAGLAVDSVRDLTDREPMLTEISVQYATMLRLSLFAVVALVVPTTLIACSSDAAGDSSASPDTKAATPGPAVTTPVVPEDIDDPLEASIAAFERFMHLFVEASAVPDPEHPGLTAAASGDALDSITQALQTRVERGQRSEGQPQLLGISVKDAALDTEPVQVAIVTCQDSTDWIVVDAATGEPVPDEDYGRRHIEALVERIDGHWYVTRLAIRGTGSC